MVQGFSCHVESVGFCSATEEKLGNVTLERWNSEACLRMKQTDESGVYSSRHRFSLVRDAEKLLSYKSLSYPEPFALEENPLQLPCSYVTGGLVPAVLTA